MEDEDLRRFASIQRSDQLLKEWRLPGTAIAAAANRLAVVRAELESLTDREYEAKCLLPSDGREIEKRCRDLRKEYLSPIFKAARSIEGFMKFTPGATAALKVPHPSHSAARHVAAGRRVMKFMKEHRVAFIRETGFDRDFLGKLRAATDALRVQSTFMHKTRGERSVLLRAIKSRLTLGRSQIDLLSVLMEPILIERHLTAHWEMASRVGKKKGRRRDTPEQRAEKRLVKAQRHQERLVQRRLKREQQREARRARRLARKAARARPG